MEPNAGDIYGVQQQRRMSKSNSRVRMDPHRMSVATGKKKYDSRFETGYFKRVHRTRKDLVIYDVT